MTETFPRSKLLQTVRDHPIATAATLAALVYFGPRKIARIGLAGLQATSRNATAIAPVLQQIIRNSRR